MKNLFSKILLSTIALLSFQAANAAAPGERIWVNLNPKKIELLYIKEIKASKLYLTGSGNATSNLSPAFSVDTVIIEEPALIDQCMKLALFVKSNQNLSLGFEATSALFVGAPVAGPESHGFSALNPSSCAIESK